MLAVFILISLKGCLSLYYLEANENAKFIYSHDDYGSDKYPNNYSEQWRLYTTVENNTIEVTLLECSIEYTIGKGGEKFCSWNYDLLSFFNVEGVGNDTVYTYLQSSCCNNSIQSLQSSGQYLEVRFETDTSGQYDGFKLQYKTYGPSRRDPMVQNSASSQSDSMLNKGVIAVAVIVTLLVLVVLIIVIVWFYKKKTQMRVHTENELHRKQQYVKEHSEEKCKEKYYESQF